MGGDGRAMAPVGTGMGIARGRFNELLKFGTFPASRPQAKAVSAIPRCDCLGSCCCRQGTVVDVDGERTADVLAGSDGRIRAVGPDLASAALRGGDGFDEVVDAPGLLVVPGGVDAHTMHLPVGVIRVSDDSPLDGCGRGGRHHHGDRLRHRNGARTRLGRASRTWQRWAEPAAVDGACT